MRLSVLLVLLAACLPPAYAAEPLSGEQGQAILDELKAIRGLLERIERRGGFDRPRRAAAPPATATVSVKGRPFIGDAGAPLTLVEFTDYQCPFCRRFVQTVYPELYRRYVDTGQLRIVVKDLPLPMHQHARGAAEAALCAGEQDRYFEMHDRLFEQQTRLARGDLAAHARSLELDVAAFDECLASDRKIAMIEADEREAASQSITGTPTFVLGRTIDGDTVQGVRIRGAQPLARFEQHIKAMLAQRPG